MIPFIGEQNVPNAGLEVPMVRVENHAWNGHFYRDAFAGGLYANYSGTMRGANPLWRHQALPAIHLEKPGRSRRSRSRRHCLRDEQWRHGFRRVISQAIRGVLTKGEVAR
ncbi:hypothetical protein [Xanthomonas sacchari]|uniref:hypothetical protein n=1 Tax=Xanthomonas sacchari TaxID=56458 RepID=UPI0020C32AF0|nr:hypothetical protein [Xanthomonas sacchari]